MIIYILVSVTLLLAIIFVLVRIRAVERLLEERVKHSDDVDQKITTLTDNVGSLSNGKATTLTATELTVGEVKAGSLRVDEIKKL